MSKLNNRDNQILTYISEQINIEGESPTIEGIRSFFNLSSATTVQRSIKKLENHGLVLRSKNKSRGITLPDMSSGSTTVNIPILAGVSCGVPNLAIADTEGYVPTDRSFIMSPDDYYYLRAEGDSMNLAGINSGDLVLIKRQNYAQDGDRVLALIDDRATIKVLKKGNGYVMLAPQSSNSDHKPIILKEDFLVQGVVERVFCF